MLWKPNKFRVARTKARSRGKFFYSIFLVIATVMVAQTKVTQSGDATSQTTAHDPGVRGGPAGAGTPIAGLTASQLAFFNAGTATFQQIDSVTGSVTGTGTGLGPRFNAESCAQCHAQPAIGGSSPSMNPELAAAIDQGATNQVPSFITANGPVREARFPFASDLKTPDGGVHALFTITGRSDASGCNLTQPDFVGAANTNNLIFRIPTPVFGDGLIESITDTAILANITTNTILKQSLGIGGRPNKKNGDGISGTTNTSGNDGTITRFGWKAQNKSVQGFSGEAYNVEMGVTNELFPNERDETPGCQFNGTPEDSTNFDLTGTAFPSDIIRFATFMRFLDQPKPVAATTSTTQGEQLFTSIGCALCHTPSFTTGQSSVTALSSIQANLFSDLLLHHMGPQLADDIAQGQAAGDEFRTAPLWGLGQRIFFLHDGRTSDLVSAITSHSGKKGNGYPDSEANAVIKSYKKLNSQDQQDLLNFLRSL